jgi:hypothetical protein
MNLKKFPLNLIEYSENTKPAKIAACLGFSLTTHLIQT